MMKGKEERRIEIARAKLLLRYPFQGGMLCTGRHLLDETVETACTDGSDYYYNPKWTATLDDEMLATLLMHEAEHNIRLHPWRLGSREHDKFNIAADHEINLSLQKEGCKLPPNGCCDPQYANMSAEQIYAQIPDPPKRGGKPGGDGASGTGKPGQEPGEGKGKEGKGKFGEFRKPKGSEAEQHAKKVIKEVEIERLAKIAKQQGKLPGWAEIYVKGLSESKVSWRDQLQVLMTSVAKDDYSWNRANRRFIASGVYMPSLYSLHIGTVVVAIDTSGSCLGDQEDFLGHLQAILDSCNPERLIAIYCDATVERVDELDRGESIQPRSYGGGGTSFVPPFEYIDAQGIEPAVLVYLTDGYGTFPQKEPGYPVVWAMTTDVKPKFGEIVRVKDE